MHAHVYIDIQTDAAEADKGCTNLQFRISQSVIQEGYYILQHLTLLQKVWSNTNIQADCNACQLSNTLLPSNCCRMLFRDSMLQQRQYLCCMQPVRKGGYRLVGSSGHQGTPAIQLCLLFRRQRGRVGHIQHLQVTAHLDSRCTLTVSSHLCSSSCANQTSRQRCRLAQLR